MKSSHYTMGMFFSKVQVIPMRRSSLTGWLLQCMIVRFIARCEQAEGDARQVRIDTIYNIIADVMLRNS